MNIGAGSVGGIQPSANRKSGADATAKTADTAPPAARLSGDSLMVGTAYQASAVAEGELPIDTDPQYVLQPEGKDLCAFCAQINRHPQEEIAKARAEISAQADQEGGLTFSLGGKTYTLSAVNRAAVDLAYPYTSEATAAEVDRQRQDAYMTAALAEQDAQGKGELYSFTLDSTVGLAFAPTNFGYTGADGNKYVLQALLPRLKSFEGLTFAEAQATGMPIYEPGRPPELEQLVDDHPGGVGLVLETPGGGYHMVMVHKGPDGALLAHFWGSDGGRIGPLDALPEGFKRASYVPPDAPIGEDVAPPPTWGDTPDEGSW